MSLIFRTAIITSRASTLIHTQPQLSECLGDPLPPRPTLNTTTTSFIHNNKSSFTIFSCITVTKYWVLYGPCYLLLTLINSFSPDGHNSVKKNDWQYFWSLFSRNCQLDSSSIPPSQPPLLVPTTCNFQLTHVPIWFVWHTDANVNRYSSFKWRTMNSFTRTVFQNISKTKLTSTLFLSLPLSERR